jgi:hypothetical protein
MGERKREKSEGKRISNQGIFVLVGMAVKFDPYYEASSQVHKV